MKLAKGNRALAAAALGISGVQLKDKIKGDPQLAAVYNNECDPPGDVETMVKAPSQLERIKKIQDEKPDFLALQVMKSDMELLRKGLERAGIKPETITKLKIFEGFSDNTGRFLVSTLDVMHRLQVYQAMAIFEEGEYIREQYMHNMTLSQEIRLEWTRRYNEITDLLIKVADRTVVATETVARMLKSTKPTGGEGKRKAGFEPLRPKPVKPA